jgi:PAS domain S-box-containing protein
MASTDRDGVKTMARDRASLRTGGVLLVVLVELVVAATVGWGLWMLRRETLASELRSLASLSAAMAVQADSTLGVADAILGATRAELGDGLLDPASASAHDFLRARASALPLFRSLLIVDAEGQRMASSRQESLQGPPVADLDFFVAAREGREPALYVGTPFVSHIDGRASIGISMDWRDKQGQFRGVVVLVADADFLDGGFEQIAPEPDVTLALYRNDHTLVSDGPGDGSARLLPAPVMDGLWADPAPETPRMATLPDGRQRLVAAHRLKHFPLMVVVSRDVNAALDDWTDQAWLVGSFAASALAMTLFLSLRNAREQALRREAQAALATEQARAVRAFQAAQEGHWEWDVRKQENHLSPRMKELLGMAPDETLHGPDGLLHLTHLHPDDVEPVRTVLRAHQQGQGNETFDFTFRVRGSDGQWRHVRSRGHAWRDADGTARLFSGTGTDVTAEVEAQLCNRQLENQLHRARKLEALGTLAGGVAHDFNNILAAVVGFGELARNAVAEGSAQARHLDHILQAGQRGKALVERILSFSRGTPRARSKLRLEPVIQEVLELLAASLPAQVRLDRQLQAPEAVISGDVTMVYEAAMNLCTNALQAMPQSGTLAVALAEVRLVVPQQLFDRSLAPGRYARLTVCDSGAGIAPEVMARLFEPFFTTRGPHLGTGLGLAVVHGVMVDLGGAIDVQSTPGHGAQFMLYFPCVDAPPDDLQPADADAPQGQGQTVLVVDDEPGLVELAEELLAALGYEPVGFSSSAQALAEFQRDPERFDLLLTDEVMPGLTGTALAQAVHGLRPGLPVVLASGYGGPQLASRAAGAGVTVLLKKPLVRAELARALAQALA